MMMPGPVVSYMYAQRFTSHGETVAGSVLTSTLAFFLVSPLAFWYVGAPIAATG